MYSQPRISEGAPRGFLLSGFLLALLGSLLPAWGYHLASPNSAVGSYFLCLSSGVLGANFLPGIEQKRSLIAACSVASFSLAALSFVAPPAWALWRLLGWAAIGISAGLLNTALVAAMTPGYKKDSASTLASGAIYFGIGCLASALLVAGTFYLYSVATILRLSAAIPAAVGILYWRCGESPILLTLEPGPEIQLSTRFHLSPGAIMLALLLCFQSGNEWAVAGWLPIFLIRRLGVSPETAVWMLALYWTALLAGRFTTIFLLPITAHGRLLFVSATAALVGCFLLVFTGNQFGAITGILLVGGGFAAIYPLVTEKIGHGVRYFRPGAFRSIFSLALAAGMLAPWTLGFLADWLGLWVVMGLPALGTLLVVILLLLLWLENKVTGQ